MNIAAIGHKRFRIASLNHDLPYLVGNVEDFPLDKQHPEAQARAARRLRPWIERYMDTLSEIEGIELDTQQLPDEPTTLAYLAATLLQVPANKKQHLLATEGVVTLLEEMRTLYRHEVAFVKAMLEHQARDQGVFSLN
jgi:Lon protease-like protein